jgi:MFS family permease
VRAGELGVATPLLPVLWCVFHVAKSGGNMIAGRAVDKVGAKPMIVFGWLFYAGIYLAFAVAASAWHVWLLFLGYALFYALTEPAEKTLVANLVGKDRTGLAYGWFNCAIGIATLPASLVFGWLYQVYGALAAFGVGAALAMVATLMLTSVRAK